MFNEKAQQRILRVDNKTLEVVEEYNYLGQILKLTRDNEHEIKRRITLGWKAFGRQSKIMESSLPICLKQNQCVLPTMICGSEIWKPTKPQNQWRVNFEVHREEWKDQC